VTVCAGLLEPQLDGVIGLRAARAVLVDDVQQPVVDRAAVLDKA